MDTVLDSAQADVKAAFAALRDLQDLDFWKIPELDLLALAQSIEGLARLGYAAQVRVAGEVDTRHTAASFGSASTVALLRETLTISAPDARARVNTAKMVLPQVQPSGGVADPVLPDLAAALAGGSIGVEQTRTIVATIKGTRNPDPGMLEEAKKVLVAAGAVTEPKPFAAFAKSVAHALDLDGKPDNDAADRVQLTIGTRNPDTGLTGIRGQLDDVGVELLGKAIEGLTNTTPGQDGTPDRRTPAVRRGHALKEVLTRYLNVGDTPTHGGERPHITLTVDFEDLRNRIGAAYLELGGVITAGEVRLLACDADIIPMVMNGKSEVLDVGRARRLFTAPIRKAITQRDRGCCFPGCDRPPAFTDAHHVLSWLDGGDSCYDNGCLLCRFHHTEVHKGFWKINWGADGIPEFIPPPWVDPEQKPRRNTTHRVTDLLNP
jgi:hypothetical protein